MSRTFKSKSFARLARKARVSDAELCRAVEAARLGQCDDLGGGVVKKRLNNNEHRAIILVRRGEYWIYEYIFAKKDQQNIDDYELEAFRLLAKSYFRADGDQFGRLIQTGALIEICAPTVE